LKERTNTHKVKEQTYGTYPNQTKNAERETPQRGTTPHGNALIFWGRY